MLTFLSIYLFSAGFIYLYVHLSHSKGGIFEGGTPNDSDIYLTFVPVMNTIFCVIMWFAEWPLKEIEEPEESKLPVDRSKFFRIKK